MSVGDDESDGDGDGNEIAVFTLAEDVSLERVEFSFC